MIIEISLFIISISGATFNYFNNKINNRVIKAEIYRVEKALLETSINNNKMCSFIFQKVFDDNLKHKTKLLKKRGAICPIGESSLITQYSSKECTNEDDILPPFFDLSKELENKPLLHENNSDNIQYTDINELNKDFKDLKISYDLNKLTIE
jgi:hypothetical protein